MGSYKIILADDHTMFRMGIRKIIEDADGLEIIGEVGDGLSLLKMLSNLSPDLVILDISMPNLRGIEAAGEIKRLYPHTKLLFLTMHRDKEYFRHAVNAGADGYLLKEDADTELFLAITRIRAGKDYISPLIKAELTQNLIAEYRGKESITSENLTKREKQVIQLIAEGKSSKEIGDLLFISIRTVHNHRANIMKKLNFRKSTELVKYAIKKGYTSIVE